MTSMTDPTAPVPVERTEEIPWIAPHAQSPTTPAPAAGAGIPDERDVGGVNPAPPGVLATK